MREQLQQALIQAALNLSEETRAHEFSILVPGTTPQLFVSLSERDLASSEINSVVLETPEQGVADSCGRAVKSDEQREAIIGAVEHACLRPDNSFWTLDVPFASAIADEVIAALSPVAPTTQPELAIGTLSIVGSIDVAEPDGEKITHPRALLIDFDSVDEIRKAIADHKCAFKGWMLPATPSEGGERG